MRNILRHCCIFRVYLMSNTQLSKADLDFIQTLEPWPCRSCPIHTWGCSGCTQIQLWEQSVGQTLAEHNLTDIADKYWEYLYVCQKYSSDSLEVTKCRNECIALGLGILLET